MRPTLGRRPAGIALALSLTAASALAAQSRAERTEDYLAAYHAVGRFNGAALVIDRGRVLYEGAFGFATEEDGSPATVDTRFRIASLTKQFTAALILRLSEQGLIDLDAPVSAYIPEYPKPQGDRITIHGLLTHTSGLPSYTNIPGFLDEHATTPLSPGEIVALTWEAPLEFEPGTRFAYSNSGYVLLGWVAERVTGMPYDEALAARVLDPLGLDATGYDHEVVPGPGHARGYDRTLSGYEPARRLDPTLPHAAGMLYSTTGDLRRWNAALFGWGGARMPFEQPETIERMLTPELDGYAYGIGVSTRRIGREDAVRVVQHTGGIFGFSSIVRAFPDHERLIVLLDNTSSSLGPIAEGLTALLWGEEAVRPKPSIAERLYPIVESGGAEAAVRRYRDWRRTRPDEYDYAPSELMRLAGHFHERGDPETATRLLEALVEEVPEGPVGRYALAELYAEAGDTAGAVAQLETGLSYEPGVPQLLRPLLDLGAEPDPVLRLPRVEVAPETLETLVGDYRIDPSTLLSVTLEEGELRASRTGEPAFVLVPQSDTVFLLHGSRVQLQFRVEGSAATAVSIVESGQRVTFPRERGAP